MTPALVEVIVLLLLYMMLCVWAARDPHFVYPWELRRIIEALLELGGHSRAAYLSVWCWPLRLRAAAIAGTCGVILVILCGMLLEAWFIAEHRGTRLGALIIAAGVFVLSVIYQEQIHDTFLARRLRGYRKVLLEFTHDVRRCWASEFVCCGSRVSVKVDDRRPQFAIVDVLEGPPAEWPSGIARRFTQRLVVDLNRLPDYMVELCDDERSPESFVDDFGEFRVERVLLRHWAVDNNLFLAKYSVKMIGPESIRP
jgi:hypothetical protein